MHTLLASFLSPQLDVAPIEATVIGPLKAATHDYDRFGGSASMYRDGNPDNPLPRARRPDQVPPNLHHNSNDVMALSQCINVICAVAMAWCNDAFWL
jgi:hypothetical protein